MTAWIDLLILIPCWLGVFGVIALSSPKSSDEFRPALAQLTAGQLRAAHRSSETPRRAHRPLAEHGSKSRSDQSDRKQPGERFEEEVNPETHFTGPSFK